MPSMTVEDVARSALAKANAGSNFLIASQWVNERYRQLIRQIRYPVLRKEGELTLPGEITTGTVSATRGSKTVTGDATAAAAWSHDIVGRFIRVAVGWYEIEGVSGVSITLKSQYAEIDASAVTYHIVVRNHKLPENVKHTSMFVFPRMRRPLINKTLEFLDQTFPGRPLVSGLLQYVVDKGVEGRQRVIEVYPAPTEVEMLRYSYWEDPENLTMESTLPPFLDADILGVGVLSDCLQYKATLAADAGKPDIAAFYLNWASREETLWQQRVREALKAAKNSYDETIQLLGFGTSSDLTGDIMTARDQILSRWTPLS
jgi:hypothetical protein